MVILGAAMVSMAGLLVWWTIAANRTAANAVTRNLTEGLPPITDMRKALLEHGAGDRAVRPAVDLIAARARQLTPAGRIEALEHKILLAGAPSHLTLEKVLAAKLVLGGGAAAFSVLRFLGAPGMLNLLLGVAGTAIGFFAPDVYLSGRAQERQQTLKRSMADTLDQMTVSVEAGLGFEAAMARAGKTGKGPLADELLRTLQDIQAGMARTDALRALGDRTDVPELRHFIVAVLQAESYGIPIAQVLRVQASEMRIKRRQEAEEKAMKLPVKILFPLILCIFPTIFIVLLGPAAMQIARQL